MCTPDPVNALTNAPTPFPEPQRRAVADAGAPLIVGIGGTNRTTSSSGLALQACLGAVARLGARTAVVSGADLTVPIFEPESKERVPAVEKTLRLIRLCDGMIIATPSYHNSISAQLKNILDYVEDLRGDERPYLSGRAVGCIAIGEGWQGAVSALTTVRTIVHALRGWPTSLGVVLNSADGKLFDVDGNCIDGNARDQIKVLARQVVEFALAQRSLLGWQDCRHLAAGDARATLLELTREQRG